jgi:chromosome segregation ATPase
MAKQNIASATSAADKGAPARSSLPNEMRSVTTMIRDLEEQLDRMLETNDALKYELEAERKLRAELEKNTQQLQETIRRGEQEVAAKDNLVAEIGQLHNQRSRLTTSVQELERRLADLERDHKSQASLVKRLHAAQADALEEVQSVESQFERAMRMVSQLRAQVAVLTEERDALAARLRVSDDKLAELAAERDGLSAEVEQSRGAIDEIRRSLADACVASAEPIEQGGRR